MVQIIEEQPSFAQIMARGGGKATGNFASGLLGQHMQNKENDSLQRMGLDLSGIHDPELRKLLVQGTMKKKEDASVNKIKTLEGLQGSIQQMKDLVNSSGIGLLGQLNPSGEARYNRGQLQTLKGELLNYYKTLFPRGLTQQEFKKLESDYLPGDYDTSEKMLGKLDAFSNLIDRKLESEGLGTEKEKKGKVKFNLKNPEHKAKRDQLMKKFGGDRDKVAQALLREFEE